MRVMVTAAAVAALVGCTSHRTSSDSSSVSVAVVRPTSRTSAQQSARSVTVHVPTQPVQVAQPTPLPAPTVEPSDDRIGQMIAAARTWLGVPYSWGGCSKAGVDCSCFVRNVLALLGINAPRVTTQQIAWATPVSQAEARAGDLVFFDNTCTGCGPNPTHVGLYLGGGSMIDAGDPVRVERVYSGHNARYGRPPGL